VGNGLEALLFDLGRVLFELDTARVHARWAELAGVSVGDIGQRYQQRVVGSETFLRHELGEISDAEFFEHLRCALEIDLTNEQVSDGWNMLFVDEMPGIRRILSQAHKVLPLYVFSNTNSAHQAYWSIRFADLLTPFRKIYLSNEIGARKPEVAAFQLVAADMGVPPQRILFFDDLAANIAGARSCGLRAVQVTTTADIERALTNYLAGERR
jgi:HAD superfamily hydrolase (TIGR01509 family)